MFKDGSEGPLVACVAIIQALVKLKLSFVFAINCIVGQMHKKII